MLASVYSYRVMVKSVSSCCVRGSWVLSNPVTYTDSSHELRDLQHFMSEQIDLHALSCFLCRHYCYQAPIISASTIISACSTMFYRVVTMHNRINYKV